MNFNTKTNLQMLSPANFAFVMSSGVTSIIFYKTGWPWFAKLFLFIGLTGYLGLLFLFIARIFFLKKTVLQDFKNVQRMFKYLTFSAGSNALAMASFYSNHDLLGICLAFIGVLSSVVFTYTLFCTLFFHIQVPIQSISPFWLLLAIACNYSGIILSSLWTKGILTHPLFLLIAFSFWTFGVFLYIIFMALNLYRMLFFPFEGLDMDPCYWTCMGAAAIAVVDGALFTLVPHAPAFAVTVRPFIAGMILFLWTWGTAWIPILVLMELWKFFFFKIPFSYQPSRWAMVFPMGMFTAATDLLSYSLHMPFLQGVVHVCLWMTFILWCITAYMSRFNPFQNTQFDG